MVFYNFLREIHLPFIIVCHYTEMCFLTSWGVDLFIYILKNFNERDNFLVTKLFLLLYRTSNFVDIFIYIFLLSYFFCSPIYLHIDNISRNVLCNTPYYNKLPSNTIQILYMVFGIVSVISLFCLVI